MTIHDIDGWALVVLGAAGVALATIKLMDRRQSGKRLYAPSLWPWWSGFILGWVIGGEGLSQLRAGSTREDYWWIAACACLLNFVIQTVSLIMSSRKPEQTSTASTDSFSAHSPDPEIPSEPDREIADLIQRIKAAQFSTIRLKPGYDEEEVDTFLDKLIAVLSKGGQLDQRELSGVRFATTRMRPGYVMQDVDGFLKDVARRAW
jgi:DivIVA domain-containing protein